MTLRNDEKWFIKHDRLVDNGREIMMLIQELTNFQEKDSNTSKISSKIRLNLQNYANEITNLRNETIYASNTNSISLTDQHNRNAMLDALTTRLKSLENAFKNNINSVNESKNSQRYGVQDPQRNQLLNMTENTSLWNESSYGASSSTGLASSVTHSSNKTQAPFFSLHDEGDEDNCEDQFFSNDRQQLIHKAKQSQEKNLDVLADLISKQKHAALHISNEVTTQNDMIDDISIHVDRTRQKLIRGAQDIRVVAKKSKSWPYWLIIIFLLILILTVILI